MGEQNFDSCLCLMVIGPDEEVLTVPRLYKYWLREYILKLTKMDSFKIRLIG